MEIEKGKFPSERKDRVTKILQNSIIPREKIARNFMTLFDFDVTTRTLQRWHDQKYKKDLSDKMIEMLEKCSGGKFSQPAIDKNKNTPLDLSELGDDGTIPDISAAEMKRIIIGLPGRLDQLTKQWWDLKDELKDIKDALNEAGINVKKKKAS